MIAIYIIILFFKCDNLNESHNSVLFYLYKNNSVEIYQLQKFTMITFLHLVKF